MSIYQKKQRWKWWLATGAMLIVLASLWYSQQLVQKISAEEKEKIKLWAGAVQKKANLVKTTNELFTKIKAEERKKAELYAEATKELTKEVADLGFSLRVLQDNTTVPVILTANNGKIVSSRNLDSTKEKDPAYLAAQLIEMKSLYPPIEIEYAPGKKNYLYYKNSQVFYQIKLVFDSLIKSFISEVAINSASVPVLYTDSTQQNVLAFGKIDSQVVSNPAKLSATLQNMRNQATPIEINLGGGIKNYIFYEESSTLKQLRYYPYIQLLIITLFLLIAYTLFSTARNSEQNLLFVGMSKETAHQLGTPLSSLMAWIEHLKETTLDHSIVHEMNRDVVRLQTITDRFSKIGSQPTLTTENVFSTLEHALDYLRQRSSKNITFVLKREGTISSTDALICVPLFEWVIENICKNGIDAMDGKGTITVTVQNQNHKLVIDIKDTGKGIAKNKLKAVFEPGYTTKQRGWGMGLSLCKRIIENYHNGKIFVKQSEIGKGTTFRIILGV
ncbi:MAG TPA: HAMP domain-containing sensor histidine kinase [Bacteroidia bacterium]